PTRNVVPWSSRILVGLGVAVLLTAGLLWMTGTSLSAVLEDLYVFIPFLRFDGRGLIVFDGEQAYTHAWAQCDFGPRPPGSEALQRAGGYIIEQLEAQGWTVEEQTFEYQGVTVRNLIGRKGEGTPVIIGAHYDTRAKANNDPDPARRNDPVPGGNDGASGVAVLLELARSLSVRNTGHQVWLAFFDAEDNGSGGLPGWDWIVGSTYMAEHLNTQVDFMILLDMIGDQDQRIFWEGFSTNWIREVVWGVAGDLGYSEYFIPQVGPHLIDDHRPFLNQGIPAIDIIDFDYPYWHTTGDTCDKLSVDSLTRVGRVIEETLEQRRLDLAR
ncbi:MAG: M28 family peptidase, partial [Anaerolineae bacterium]